MIWSEIQKETKLLSFQFILPDSGHYLLNCYLHARRQTPDSASVTVNPLPEITPGEWPGSKGIYIVRVFSTTQDGKIEVVNKEIVVQ